MVIRAHKTKMVRKYTQYLRPCREKTETPIYRIIQHKKRTARNKHKNADKPFTENSVPHKPKNDEPIFLHISLGKKATINSKIETMERQVSFYQTAENQEKYQNGTH